MSVREKSLAGFFLCLHFLVEDREGIIASADRTVIKKL